MIKRFLGAAVAAAALVATSGSAAHAGGPERGEYDTAWTVTSSNCTQIPEGTVLTGTGSGHFKNNVRTRADGTSIVNGLAHASGTAADQDGNVYTWTYTNNFVGEIVGGTVTGRMVDSFTVGGSGPAAYTTGFQADVVEVIGVSWDATPNWVRGDPFDFEADMGRCDPI
jgi:hypothetical protein